MDDDIRILALYLDAPLQSWGYQSRFDRRTSFSLPTRSGIVGMICAALGVDRADSKALEWFTDLKMTALAFQQNTRLTDFHTIGGGWDKKTDPGNIVLTAKGKPGTTKVTRREYLQWSKFGVLIDGSGKKLYEIEKALLNPCWGIWLGRKSCVPASPVCQGVFTSEEKARSHLSKLAHAQIQRTLEDVSLFEDGCDTLNDIPLDFFNRQFAPRRIRM